VTDEKRRGPGIAPRALNSSPLGKQLWIALESCGYELETMDDRLLGAAVRAIISGQPLAEALHFDPREWVARQQWVYAKTMPENPHHYVVRPRSPNDPESRLARREWDRFQGLILQHGRPRRYKGARYIAWTLDDHDYWAMYPVINRKPIDNASWDDDT